MSTLFDSLKKLDQKAKVEELINSEPLPIESAKPVSIVPQKWIVLCLVGLGVGLLVLALFEHFRYRDLSEAISAQYSSFVSRLDQLSQQIEGLSEKLGPIETAQQVAASRLEGLSKRVDQERQVRSEAISRHDELIDEQKNSFHAQQAQLDERLNLLSQQVSVLEGSQQGESRD